MTGRGGRGGGPSESLTAGGQAGAASAGKAKTTRRGASDETSGERSRQCQAKLS